MYRVSHSEVTKVIWICWIEWDGQITQSHLQTGKIQTSVQSKFFGPSLKPVYLKALLNVQRWFDDLDKKVNIIRATKGIGANFFMTSHFKISQDILQSF